MKILWYFKNTFKNYKYLFIILIMEFIFEFVSKNKSLQQLSYMVNSDWEKLNYSDLLNTMEYIILIVCYYSGLLFISKKIVNNEKYTMGDLAIGIEKNWLKFSIFGLLYILTIKIIIDLINSQLIKIAIELNQKIFLLGVTTVLGLLSLSIFVYGSLSYFEGKTIRGSFYSSFKFIFSKKSSLLVSVIIIPSIALDPILHYYDLNLFKGFNLFSIIPTYSDPIWVKGTRWLFNSIATSYVILYTNLTFYWTNCKYNY